MKKLPKLSLSKLSILLLAALCLGVLIYDLADTTAKDALPAEATSVPRSSILLEPSAELPATPGSMALNTPEEDNFYAEYRLQREQVRSEELELLQSIIEDAGTAKELRDRASARKLEIAQNMEYELMAENVLYAKRFGQSVVMLGQNTATVILSGPFDDIGAAQVAEAICGVTGLNYENVVIINR